MTSLDLESLVVLEVEDEARPENHPIETSVATINLPHLTKLNLKWLPPSILDPIVQNIDVSILEKVSITHDMVDEDPAKPQDPFASFIARLVATEYWVVGYVLLSGYRESWRWIWLLSLPDAVQASSVNSETPIKSWLWPELEYLNISGDSINEFTILSVLLARYGPRSTTTSITQKKDLPHRLTRLFVRPRKKAWRAEVLDRIRELVGPGCFLWDKPQ
ncbi:hypothetical protein M407DRAFT_216352 [Tulasnella calospora MUT 4182]|uniref:Uncharacterized protein n=1 Tax=Tulasnella calospora MUT 4182 TaxID=1051891 RepID=A0A0C3Q287_9AGAM|nr:hypothetical protein M407DRAFT_216352 [Tulasnella calospora MUT 4182]